MNAQGVSVFYGASTEALALAEVRPPVGNRNSLGQINEQHSCLALPAMSRPNGVTFWLIA